MSSDIMWNCEDAIKDVASHVDVPAWIAQDISPSEVAAIVQGGCASGAYMPAVTYYDATQTMTRHGDDVLQYIQDALGELPKPYNTESWGGMACFYLSCAVELWASSVEEKVEVELEARTEETPSNV